MRDLPDALEHLGDIREAVGERRPVFFLDYDGTLTPIVERPEDAVLDEAGRAVVRDLAAVTTVAVVSGRDVAFVRDQVAVEGVVYAGSHGFDIVGPVALDDEKLGEFQALLPVVDAAEETLRRKLAHVPGANVERKKFSVAAHYRQVADEDVERVTAAVDGAVAADSRLEKGLGKKVYEVRPAIDWHKGRAVRFLLEALGFETHDAIPFYVGDDVTDEDAFRELAGTGLGIAVGSAARESAAAYRVADTGAVMEFLREMTRIARGVDR
jgi:trehalose-phosphatase